MKVSVNHINNISLIFGIVLLGVSSCVSPRVYTSAKENVDFREYQTYAWLPNGDSIDYVAYDQDQINQVIIQTVNEQLQRRGMHLDREDPDALIGVHTMFEEQTRTVRQPIYNTYAYSPGWYIAPWYGPYYYPGFATVRPYSSGTIESIPYTEGTIAIDLIDSRSNEIVWRGWSRRRVDPLQFTFDVKRYVQNIFERYPVERVWVPESREISSR